VINLLAFDTSAESCSVALIYGGQRKSLFEVAPRQQAAHILGLIEKLLREADMELSRLDAIAFANGPGSFTGIRLAASVAQGLAMAKALPLVPISTLAALAQGARREYQVSQVLVATDAHAGEIYWGAYQWDGKQAMKPVIADQRCRPEEAPLPPDISTYCAIGNAWILYAERLKNQAGQIKSFLPLNHVQAIDVADLAAIALAEGVVFSSDSVVPTYLHSAAAWKRQ
jgi:tRNA threonylcarbamoyladenosine biosynthesis protein TsaB